MPNWLKPAAIGAAAMGLVMSTAANANGGGWKQGACSTHATILLSACYADRRDDYLVHRADCVYVTSKADERECRGEAREERGEKGEECKDVYEARLDLCDLVGEERYVTDFEPGDFVDPNDIGDTADPNQYWPLTAGHTHVIVAESEEDGEVVKEVVVVTATEEVRDVGGIPCRVIRDLVFEEEEDDGEVEYSALEVTQDWYGQIGPGGADRGIGDEGDTLYCGENTFEVEDDLIDNTDGSFANGTERASAGFLVRQSPVIGTGDRQEMATDEAEDYVRYEKLATSPSAAEGGDLDGAIACNGECLQTFEINPRDPGQAEYKYYLPGVGFVLATKLDEDGIPTGEREEVTCVTARLQDALDMGSACGIADAVALQEAMCAWSPEAEWLPEEFCGD